MILAVSGEPVTCFADVEGALAAAGEPAGATKLEEAGAKKRKKTALSAAGSSKRTKAETLSEPEAVLGLDQTEADLPTLSLTIFRSAPRVVEDVKLRPGVEDGMGTNLIVHFCGAQIQVRFSARATVCVAQVVQRRQ